jgi:hypothetical protein
MTAVRWGRKAPSHSARITKNSQRFTDSHRRGHRPPRSRDLIRANRGHGYGTRSATSQRPAEPTIGLEIKNGLDVSGLLTTRGRVQFQNADVPPVVNASSSSHSENDANRGGGPGAASSALLVR